MVTFIARAVQQDSAAVAAVAKWRKALLFKMLGATAATEATAAEPPRVLKNCHPVVPRPSDFFIFLGGSAALAEVAALHVISLKKIEF
jgi:hypothetical protein